MAVNHGPPLVQLLICNRVMALEYRRLQGGEYFTVTIMVSGMKKFRGAALALALSAGVSAGTSAPRAEEKTPDGPDGIAAVTMDTDCMKWGQENAAAFQGHAASAEVACAKSRLQLMVDEMNARSQRYEKMQKEWLGRDDDKEVRNAEAAVKSAWALEHRYEVMGDGRPDAVAARTVNEIDSFIADLFGGAAREGTKQDRVAANGYRLRGALLPGVITPAEADARAAATPRSDASFDQSVVTTNERLNTSTAYKAASNKARGIAPTP